MDRASMIAEVRAEIGRLNEVLNLLEGEGGTPSHTVRRGAVRRTTLNKGKTGSRTMSPADRLKRSEAQKRRWAERRKTTASAGHTAPIAGQPSTTSDTADVPSMGNGVLRQPSEPKNDTVKKVEPKAEAAKNGTTKKTQ